MSRKLNGDELGATLASLLVVLAFCALFLWSATDKSPAGNPGSPSSHNKESK
jgi:hypothetical protein